MNETLRFFLYLFCMSVVTYLIRMLPIVFVRKKIKNRFIRSFLYYIPYAVLTVIPIPAIFYATDHLLSALIGFAVAVIIAFFRRSLLTVAIGACAAAFIVEILIPYLPALAL